MFAKHVKIISKSAGYLSNMLTPKRLYSHPFFRQNEVPLEKVSLIACLGSKLCKNDQIPPKNSTKIPVKQTLNNEFVRETPARSSCCCWRNFELKHFHHIRIPMITTSCIQMFKLRLWIVRELRLFVKWLRLSYRHAGLFTERSEAGLRIDLCCSHHTWLKM